MGKLLLHTPYPPEECKRRLESATERDIPIVSDWRFTPAILARIGDESFRLRVRRRFWRNSFDPLFWGRLQSTASGATITGRFGLHPLVLIFGGLWLAGFCLIGGWIFALSAATLITGKPYMGGDVLAGVFVPIGMLTLALVFFWVGRRFGKSSERQLGSFLAKVLNATESAPAA
jgi:hypothetical protein